VEEVEEVAVDEAEVAVEVEEVVVEVEEVEVDKVGPNMGSGFADVDTEVNEVGTTEREETNVVGGQ
jgi:hypothetical protein